eukprot:6979929-Pyramimonas_sp.AAC.1
MLGLRSAASAHAAGSRTHMPPSSLPAAPGSTGRSAGAARRALAAQATAAPTALRQPPRFRQVQAETYLAKQ